MDKATIFLANVPAYPYEFGSREREAFSQMHPECAEQSRLNYVLRLLEKAGYCTVIAFPSNAGKPWRRQHVWVDIL